MPPHGPEEDADAHLFAGVRFVLHGFDQVSASQVRAAPPNLVRSAGSRSDTRSDLVPD
jgi:hypothetical protein